MNRNMKVKAKVNRNPKISLVSVGYFAGPVAANSPAVLTPPIPQWGPCVVRGGAPVRHATRCISPLLKITYVLGLRLKKFLVFPLNSTSTLACPRDTT